MVTQGYLNTIFPGNRGCSPGIPKANVLLVDNDAGFQKLLQRYVYGLNCQLDIVCDGFSAIRLFKQYQYDLIFMGCQVEGLNGYRTTQKIRHLEWNKKACSQIIGVSEFIYEDNKQKCLESGMNGFAPKPLNRQIIKNYLMGMRLKQICYL